MTLALARSAPCRRPLFLVGFGIIGLLLVEIHSAGQGQFLTRAGHPEAPGAHVARSRGDLALSPGPAAAAGAPGAFPIATTSAIESGFEAVFGGSRYLVAVGGVPLAEGPVTAQLLSLSGERLGPPSSPPGEWGGMPDVAFDGTNYLMVWAGTEAAPGVSGQLIGQNGELVGPVVRISTSGSGSPRATNVEFAAGRYLVCWSDNQSVRGQFIAPSGQLEGESFLVSGTVPRAREHAIGFDGARFLVVFNGGGDLRPNIYGQAVSADGELRGGTRVLDENADPSDNPVAVAFDGARYLVVFNDQVGGVETGSMRVFGRLVSPSGDVLSDRLALSDRPGVQLFPFVASDASSHLVVWSEIAGSTSLQVVAQFLDLAGRPLGPVFSPLSAQGTNAPAFGAPLFDGERYLVTAVLASFTGGLSAASGEVYGRFLPRSPRLDILPSPGAGQMSVLLTGSPGFDYTIQMTPELAAPGWTALVTNSPATGTFQFTDAQATNASRFYRAASQMGL